MDGAAGSPVKRQRVTAERGGVVPRHEPGRSYHLPGMLVREHSFTVPLDYSASPASRHRGGTLRLFARELLGPQRNEALPFLVFLQGGPGFEAPRLADPAGWVKAALASYRVLLLDQRGTGLSTPVTTVNLAAKGGPEEQADYLACFRADSIVRDCEAVRRLLVPPTHFGGRWAVLGQSFGGFCAVTYLSQAPEGLMEALITGGLPPGLDAPCAAEAVYAALHRRVATANNKYYERYPGDVAHVQRIVSHLSSRPGGGERLPSGSLLTPRLLQTLGLSGLGSGGGFERLHFLLEGFFDGEGNMNPAFAKSFEMWQSWDANPLYALLHEPIYCQGGEAAAWAADRVRSSPAFAQLFDAEAAVREGRPVMFTGECVYSFMYDDIAALRPYKATAEVLAARTQWGPLYDRDTLGRNTVPAAALAYLDDMYVDYELSKETASALRGLKLWATNEYRHSGIRDDGGRILERLLGLARNTILE